MFGIVLVVALAGYAASCGINNTVLKSAFAVIGAAVAGPISYLFGRKQNG